MDAKTELEVSETIAAIATPIGSGGISIVRISGSNAVNTLTKLWRGKYPPTAWHSHTMHYGHICYNDTIIDECMAVIMHSPRSYTCEDTAEIHCHGGIRAVNSVLSAVLDSGARLARPGEFTLRAFLSGRIDITQAEAVADIINSKTDYALATAQNQLAGALSAQIRSISDKLIELLAHIEVSIDYPEHDEDIINQESVVRTSSELLPRLDTLIESFSQGKILREGIATLIIGKPNSGKSSLLNALLGEERAIVTDIPGTTRDTLTESISIGGVPIVLTDTAGIRNTDDVVERMGVERSLAQLDTAQLVFWVVDSTAPLNHEDFDIAQNLSSHRVVVLLNKCDIQGMVTDRTNHLFTPALDIIEISLLQDHPLFISGMERLVACVNKSLGLRDISENSVLVTSLRHREVLVRSKLALLEAREAAIIGASEDIVSIPLREALDALGELTGETVSEDILDKIFSQFCLGK